MFGTQSLSELTIYSIRLGETAVAFFPLTTWIYYLCRHKQKLRLSELYSKFMVNTFLSCLTYYLLLLLPVYIKSSEIWWLTSWLNHHELGQFVNDNTYETTLLRPWVYSQYRHRAISIYREETLPRGLEGILIIIVFHNVS